MSEESKGVEPASGSPSALYEEDDNWEEESFFGLPMPNKSTAAKECSSKQGCECDPSPHIENEELYNDPVDPLPCGSSAPPKEEIKQQYAAMAKASSSVPVCSKCKEQPGTLVCRNDITCKECF